METLALPQSAYLLKALILHKEETVMSKKLDLVEVEVLEAMCGPIENLDHYEEFHYWNTLLSFYGLDAIPTTRKEVG